MTSATGLIHNPIVTRVHEADELWTLVVKPGVGNFGIPTARVVPEFREARLNMGLIHQASIKARVSTERHRRNDFFITPMAINTAQRDSFVVVHGVTISLGMTGDAALALSICFRLTLMTWRRLGLDIFALNRFFTFTGQSSSDPQEGKEDKLK